MKITGSAGPISWRDPYIEAYRIIDKRREKVAYKGSCERGLKHASSRDVCGAHLEVPFPSPHILKCIVLSDFFSPNISFFF